MKAVPAPEAAPRKVTTQPRWLRYTISAAIGIEVLLLLACLGRAVRMLNLGFEADRLLSSQKQADSIRQAWAELADQGRVLRARLEQSKAKPLDTIDYLQASLKKARLQMEISGPAKMPKTGRVSNLQFRITGSGLENRVLNFLQMLDNLPSIAEIEEVSIRGASKGRVDLYVSLIHRDYPSSVLKKLKGLIRKLPSVPPIPTAARKPRDGRLFAPVVLPPEAVLSGWSNILLSGFSENNALIIVDGEPITVSEGKAVTKGITFVEKLSVNQAVIRRSSDGAEIILTVGSRSYAVKPSPLRDMGEFVLAVQRRGSSELLRTDGSDQE